MTLTPSAFQRINKPAAVRGDTGNDSCASWTGPVASGVKFKEARNGRLFDR